MNPRPWEPKPFTVAVLDSDEYLGDVLCELLRARGIVASSYADIGLLAQAHQTEQFDAYVLDYLADWSPDSNALEMLIASVRGATNSDAPIFVLGNQSAPERIERLAAILMQHKVRYVLRPVRAHYLAREVAAALARKAGL